MHQSGRHPSSAHSTPLFDVFVGDVVCQVERTTHKVMYDREKPWMIMDVPYTFTVSTTRTGHFSLNHAEPPHCICPQWVFRSPVPIRLLSLFARCAPTGLFLNFVTFLIILIVLIVLPQDYLMVLLDRIKLWDRAGNRSM
jgi:hypothetical protein